LVFDPCFGDEPDPTRLISHLYGQEPNMSTILFSWLLALLSAFAPVALAGLKVALPVALLAGVAHRTER
jgi:hypothetical protein